VSIASVPGPTGQPTVQLQRSTDFAPLLTLARVAPPTADVELSRVTELSDQPPDQVFRLLLIGQGFLTDEFPQIVQQALGVNGQGGVVDTPPLNLLAANAGRNAFACYFDSGTHADGTGLSLPLRQETVGTAPIDQLRIAHPGLVAPQVVPKGRTLAEYLSHLTVRLADGTVHRATEYWPVGTRLTGATGALIAVLRRASFLTHQGTPPDPARPAELYQLDPTTDDQVPFVAVNVVGNDWPLVLARAIAQNLAGLADEYELEGTSFAQPGEGVLSPIAPNLTVISDTSEQSLIGGTAAANTIVPGVFTDWHIPAGATVNFVQHTSATANPIPAWDGVTQNFDLHNFDLVEGGGGFRTHVLRCARDCLMRRIPAPVSNTVENPPTPAPRLPIQSPLRSFCNVCDARLRSVITGRTSVRLAPRVEIDTQRRLFDSLVWNGNPITALNTATLATTVVTTGPTWTCTAEFAPSAGFRFTNINLANVDYWAPGSPAHVAHVFDSVTFDGFQVDYVDGTTDTFRLTNALAPTAPAPTFRAFTGGDSHGHFQIGASLLVSWQKSFAGGRSYILDAELSLVLGAMDNNVDPSGIMMGCCIFPQLAMRVRHITPRTKAIKALRGAITLNANNADASNLTGALATIATGRLTTSLFCESNRASAGGGTGGGIAVDSRKRAAFTPPAGAPANRLLPPPHWSWIYDYCNVGITAAVMFVGAYSRNDTGAKGTTTRDQVKAWPANQTATSESIHKVPRQAVYDTLYIHPDRGNDAAGQPLVMAPYCADLGLVLHWRRGVSPSGGPAPLHVYRGWGAGRLGQGARTVIGAPEVPPNHHVNLTVTPQASRAQVALKYAVVADEFAPERWQVFLEQGLAYTFQ